MNNFNVHLTLVWIPKHHLLQKIFLLELLHIALLEVLYLKVFVFVLAIEFSLFLCYHFLHKHSDMSFSLLIGLIKYPGFASSSMAEQAILAS